ncbi:MAG: RNA polymerase factor sigma-54, partial [Planctomycetes bacterium]|nr:RNA polymerase factor sigma-54 [Planctomycetota bacterium]
GKHVQTDFGIFPLRCLFDGGKGVGSDARGNGGESRTSIREHLRAMVDGEDPKEPLSDEQLVQEFAKRGLDVARRTIAKYRNELGIPSSFRRRCY